LATLEVLKDTAVEYGAAMRLLLTAPGEFFAGGRGMPGCRRKLVFALPPVLVYAAATGAVLHNAIWTPVYLVAAYAYIGVWALTLRYVLVPFGEKRSFEEALYIAVCASPAFLIAWVPVVGGPVAALAAGLLTILGLVHRFKMHGGAALAVVTLPVVLVGLSSVFLSFIFMALASLSSIFGS